MKHCYSYIHEAILMTCIFVAKLSPFSKNLMLSRGQVQFKGNLYGLGPWVDGGGGGDAELLFRGVIEALLAI